VPVTRRSLVAHGLSLLTASAVSPTFGAARTSAAYLFVDGLEPLRRLLAGGARGADAVARFREHVITPLTDAYGLVETLEDAVIAQYLEKLQAQPSSIETLSTDAPSLFADLWQRFSAVVPLASGTTVVYLLPAPAQAIAGSVRYDGQRDVVILGAEVMSFLKGAGVSGATFLHHELGHVYHHQQNDSIRQAQRRFFAGGRAALFEMMWLEGLGVHLSQVLNPTASVFDLFRSRTLEAEMRARWPRLRGMFRDMLATEDREQVTALLYDGDATREIPAKAGYYVGFHLARELARNLSTRRLARLHGEALRAALTRGLENLAFESEGVS
jgi:hypothetical protein